MPSWTYTRIMSEYHPKDRRGMNLCICSWLWTGSWGLCNPLVELSCLSYRILSGVKRTKSTMYNLPSIFSSSGLAFHLPVSGNPFEARMIAQYNLICSGSKHLSGSSLCLKLVIASWRNELFTSK